MRRSEEENCLDNVVLVHKLNFLTLADLDSLLGSKSLDKTTPKRWQGKQGLEKKNLHEKNIKLSLKLILLDVCRSNILTQLSPIWKLWKWKKKTRKSRFHKIDAIAANLL